MINNKKMMRITEKYRCYMLPLLFVMLVLVQTAFVWWLPWFPTQDGPCHIYNLAILKDLRNGGHIWGKWFEQSLTITPNLGFHLLAYPFLFYVDPQIAERLFIALYIILFSITIPLSLKLLDLPRFPWSFLVFPAVWSYSFAMGFYSFVIALPFLAISMAVTVRMHATSLLARFIVTGVISAVLFIIHLIPFSCFGLFLAVAAALDKSKAIAKRFIAALIILMPFIIMLLWHLSVSVRSPRISSPGFLERLPWLIVDIATCSTVYFSALQVVSGSLLGLLLYALARNYHVGQSVGYYSRVFGLFALVMMVLTIVSPPSPGGGGFFNQRLPSIMLLALIPLFATGDEYYHVKHKKIVLPVVYTFILITFHSFFIKSNMVSEFMSEQGTPLTAGGGVMACRDYGQPGSRVDVLAHAASHYALLNSLIYAGNYEMQFPYFQVRYRPEMSSFVPLADDVNYRWHKLNFEKYGQVRYLLVWDTMPPTDSLYRFKKICESGRMSVWQRSSNLGDSFLSIRPSN